MDTAENTSTDKKKIPENKESGEDKGGKIIIDLTQPSTSNYVQKFLWPDKFLNSESRKDTDPFEPIQPKDIAGT